MGIGLYGTLFGQAPWKFLLDVSNKRVIESNSRYIKFISLKKESIKCPTAIRTPGKPCKHKMPNHRNLPTGGRSIVDLIPLRHGTAEHITSVFEFQCIYLFELYYGMNYGIMVTGLETDNT